MAKNWTREELIITLQLYMQITFGRMSKSSPEVIALAEKLDRTPSSIAMKLVNFASLDPEITQTQRKGLGNTSQLDREVWAEIQSNWSLLFDDLLDINTNINTNINFELNNNNQDYFEKNTEKLVLQKARIGQSFFRKSVLSNFNNQCCISQMSVPELLIASHIIPWHDDNAKNQRLNPQNGLCLSALYDKAYDRGLITVLPDLHIKVSEKLKKYYPQDSMSKNLFDNIDGKKIRFPQKFGINKTFLDYHATHIFLN